MSDKRRVTSYPKPLAGNAKAMDMFYRATPTTPQVPAWEAKKAAVLKAYPEATCETSSEHAFVVTLKPGHVFAADTERNAWKAAYASLQAAALAKRKARAEALARSAAATTDPKGHSAQTKAQAKAMPLAPKAS